MSGLSPRGLVDLFFFFSIYLRTNFIIIVMVQSPSCSIFRLRPLGLEFSSSHRSNFHSDVPKAKCGTWQWASINCQWGPKLPPQSSHSGDWSRCHTSRPCIYIKTYTATLNNQHHAHRTGNWHGNQSNRMISCRELSPLNLPNNKPLPSL